ncbi:acyl-CoA carboxylase epsilon subunit [Streptomyces sp. YIM S03343]
MYVSGGATRPAPEPASAEVPMTVLRGNPTPEELAAVVACLAAAVSRVRRASLPRSAAPSSRWARAARTGLVRAALPAGSGWRTGFGPDRG